MEPKSLLLISALVVVGLCSGFGQSRELLEDMSYDLEKFAPEKTLRELNSVRRPREAAELLAATRADSQGKIGKYSKGDFLGLLRVEPKDCMSEEVERRRALCKSAADLAGLKHFCTYFVGQLEEYCANTATWRLLQTFITLKEKDELIHDAQFVSTQVDEFTRTSGDEKQPDEANLLAYCKVINMKPRMQMAHICSRFNWLLENDLKRYAPDVNQVTSYLDSHTNSAEGTFAKAASRCRLLVDRCHKPVAALI